MGKHTVTLFCGYQIDCAHNPAQKYCNKKCLGYHEKRSRLPKPAQRKRIESERPYIPSSSPLWNQAKSTKSTPGYLVLYVRNPETGLIYFRAQHIVIWERAYGMQVPKGHCLHHLNGVPNDNRVENILCMPISLHLTLHRRLRKLSKAGLSPVQYNVNRHEIIQEVIDKTRELTEMRARWKGLPSQRVLEADFANL
jgi:hypothetical protein